MDRFTWNFACKSRKSHFTRQCIRKPSFVLKKALLLRVSVMGQLWDIERGGVNIILTLHQIRNSFLTVASILMKIGMLMLLWSGWSLMKRKAFAIEFDYDLYSIEIRHLIFEEKSEKISSSSKIAFTWFLQSKSAPIDFEP